MTKISLGLNTVENIWDTVSAKLYKLYNKDLVVFIRFSAEMLCIITLNLKCVKAVGHTDLLAMIVIDQ